MPVMFGRRVLTLSRPGGLLLCRLDGGLRGPRQPLGELEARSRDSPVDLSDRDRRLGPVVRPGALAL